MKMTKLTILWLFVLTAALALLGGCEQKTVETKPTPSPGLKAIAETTAAQGQLHDNLHAETSTSLSSATTTQTETYTEAPEPDVASTGSKVSVAYRDENLLTYQPSPYLRSLTSSPVHWQPWGKEIFQVAQKLDRPLLISLGASWSLESRLMDRETFESREVAEFLNKHFVPVKLDIDEHPDVAQRYLLFFNVLRGDDQTASVVIAALPDGSPYEATAYLPPRAETSGTMGMLEFLEAVAHVFGTQKDRATEQGKRFERILDDARQRLIQTSPSLEITREAAAQRCSEILNRISASADKGEAFSNATLAGRLALLALHHYSDTRSSSSLAVAEKVLQAVAESFLKDHVLGGYFHRIDGEGFPLDGKLLPDQAVLLRAFCLAYAATGKRVYREEAESILAFVRDTFENPSGGFYGSQQPDADPHEAGAYFSWSGAEVSTLLDVPLEREVVLRFYGLDKGDREEKRMLRPARTLSDVASSLKVSASVAKQLLTSATLLLREKRYEREDFPFVNKSLIVSWNASMVSAYADAWRYLDDSEARDFALKTASKLLESATTTSGFLHYLGRGESDEPSHTLLEDQVAMAGALLDCAEISGKNELMNAAKELMEQIQRNYAFAGQAVYLDKEENMETGHWDVRLVPIQDSLVDSPNAQVALLWFRLFRLTGQEMYLQRAARCVGVVFQQRDWWDERLATFGDALLTVAFSPPKVVIVGKADKSDMIELWHAALNTFRVGKCVELLTPDAAMTTDYLPSKDGKAVGYVCTHEACAPPAKDTKVLRKTLIEFGRN